MRLATLLAGADLAAAGVPPRQMLGDPEAVDVSAVAVDSRAVAPGTMFCCVAGRRIDGHDLAPAAVAAGATALLCQRPLELPVAQVVVDDVPVAVAPVAAALYDHPSRALTVIGVTGTNGKTTTTHLLAAIYQAAGRPAATIGTLSGTRTTPEAPLLQAALAQFRDQGLSAVAVEVSSHGLVQHRVDAVSFAAAVFTNLTQDHLDYHDTMEDYFAAKSRLFEPGRAKVAVVNADDRWGERLLEEIRTRDGEAARATIVPFSLHELENLEIRPGGSRFRWRGADVELRLGGRFNVRNALAAATAAAALGIDVASIAAGLAKVDRVRGRFEPVRAGQPFTVLVDYAHTPDGLEQALTSARELAGIDGRVIVVFGAGGDRDRSKRPLMGAIASRLADRTVLTSDNPRSEDPAVIIKDVAAGMSSNAAVEVEPDREAAIWAALANAGRRDVVLIAGKGHELVQEIAGQVSAFDDAEVARRALVRLGEQQGGW